MATDSRTLEIILKARDEASAVLTTVGRNVQGISSQFQSVGQSLTSAGRSLTTGLTLPIVGMGAAVIASANSFDNAMQTIITGTGIAAHQVEGFKKVFLDVN